VDIKEKVHASSSFLSTAKRFGYDCNRNRQFRCHVCQKTWSIAEPRLLGKMRINEANALMTIQLLIEGCSIRSIERITSIGKSALPRLLVLASSIGAFSNQPRRF
jgi:transposase-like protein